MSAQELVHEISAEKDSNIQMLKAKISRLKSHHASAVGQSSDTQEIATQLASNLDSEGSQPSFVNDEVLVKNNTAQYIFADVPVKDAFGNELLSIPDNRNEHQYQISLLSAPKRDRLYVSEQVETRNTEVITMMMLILLVVIIAVILHLIVHEVEHSVVPNDQKTYILMAHANNNDPLLKDLRYMPVSEERQTCNIM